MGSCQEMDITHVFPLRWRDIFSPFFSFTENACLGISFLLDITVPTAFILQPHKWSKIFGLENHYPCTRSDPSLLSHNLSTTLNAMLCSGLVGCVTVHTSKL
jgi:hypothetical protein